jgi:hypothetical protein
MDAEVIKQLVPFGIIGLGIVAVVVIAVNPGSTTNKALGMLAMGLIALLAIVDKLNPVPTLKAASGTAPVAETSSDSSGGMFWVDTGTSADWGGRDVAFTAGIIPKYSVKSTKLCDENHPDAIATCWDNRPNGFPFGTPTDVTGTPAQWCTYKDSSIRIFTPPDGHAIPGRVYLCGRSIPHT